MATTVLQCKILLVYKPSKQLSEVLNSAMQVKKLKISSRILQKCLNKSESSYTVEYNLGVITWYQENSEYKHPTAQNFEIDHKWIDLTTLVFDQVASLPIAFVF